MNHNVQVMKNVFVTGSPGLIATCMNSINVESSVYIFNTFTKPILQHMVSKGLMQWWNITHNTTVINEMIRRIRSDQGLLVLREYLSCFANEVVRTFHSFGTNPYILVVQRMRSESHATGDAESESESEKDSISNTEALMKLLLEQSHLRALINKNKRELPHPLIEATIRTM